MIAEASGERYNYGTEKAVINSSALRAHLNASTSRVPVVCKDSSSAIERSLSDKLFQRVGAKISKDISDKRFLFL